MARWVFLLGVGLLLVALAFVMTCEVLEHWPDDYEVRSRRVRKGMTLEEVEEILSELGWMHPPKEQARHAWIGMSEPRGSIDIYFDKQGLVGEVRFCRYPAPHPLDCLHKALDW